MEAIQFNQAQLHLFSLMSHIKTETALQQLQNQLADYYAHQIDLGMEQLWSEGKWNESTLEALSHEHNRTPYK